MKRGDFETDNDFIANIDKVDTDALFEQLEYYGCDGYYRDGWYAVITELKRRLNERESRIER